jgi:preprotein translocase subunit SecA
MTDTSTLEAQRAADAALKTAAHDHADDCGCGHDHHHHHSHAGVTVTRNGPKVGRNDACPCGSGKKYKKCCLSSAA